MDASWKLLMRRFARLESLAIECSKARGNPVQNVSSWDADQRFMEQALRVVRLPSPASIFPYRFSHLLGQETHIALRRRLGVNAAAGTLVTPNGTSANLMALTLARHRGRGRIVIAGPCYFQVPVAADGMGFEVRQVDMWSPRTGFDNWSDIDSVNEVLWLTSPIYCYGATYPEAALRQVEMQLEAGGLVIADECLARVGCATLSQRFGGHTGFIGTHSPHKAICFNGLKFGVVVAASDWTDELETWADVWTGPLHRSVVSDVDHFLSSNFEDLATWFDDHVERASVAVGDAITAHRGHLVPGLGHLRVVCVPDLPRSLEFDEEFYRDVLMTCGIAFYPSSCNLGPDDAPFGFRVNLASHLPQLLGRLRDLLHSLHARAPGRGLRSV